MDAGEMTELLVAYFVKFGDKPCCGGDLKLYLPILDASEADKFFVQTLNSINFDEKLWSKKYTPGAQFGYTFQSKFIHKDVTPFSCKFGKDDFVEQHLQLYLHSKANSFIKM